MQIVKETKRTERTWKRQRGFDQQFHLDHRPLGYRIEVFGWLEDGPQGNAGEVTVTLVEGDYWRSPEEFIEYESKRLTNPGDEEIESTVQAMAAAA